MATTPQHPTAGLRATAGPNRSPEAREAWATLADAIAADGITRHEAAVRALLLATEAGRRHPRLARLVADADVPAVVRERAFGSLPWLPVAEPAIRRPATAAA